MTISTTTIIRDEQNNPIPQYYNPATQVFEATEGANGSPNVQTTGAPLSAVSVLQNAATAAGVGTSMSVAGYATALLAVSGTFVATITFQAIGPDGNTYPVNAKNVLTGIVSSTTTGTGLYEVEVRGLSSVVANITAYTSGSVTVKGQAQAIPASGQQVSLTGNMPPLDPVTPRLLATIPYTDFTTASSSIYPYYLSSLTRSARQRTFMIYNTMNQPLTSNALAFYDSVLGITGQPGIAQTAVFTAAGSNAVSTVTSESASASSQGLVASHVDSFQAVLGIGATLPTSGNVYIYVSELL